MGNYQQAGKPSQYLSSHAGQLSLAIPPWVNIVSTSKCWGYKQRNALAMYLWSRSVNQWMAEG